MSLSSGLDWIFCGKKVYVDFCCKNTGIKDMGSGWLKMNTCLVTQQLIDSRKRPLRGLSTARSGSNSSKWYITKIKVV